MNTPYKKIRKGRACWMLLGVGVPVFMFTPLLPGQSSGGSLSTATVIVSSSSAGAVAAQVVREIDDPHTGDRWLLVRDDAHPGGPAQLILLPTVKSGEKKYETVPTAQKANVAEGSPGQFHPVIRAGDRLIVEEHSATVDTYLEAVAMGSATAGTAFSVRLKLGGKLMQAVALGPGRAAMKVGTEALP